MLYYAAVAIKKEISAGTIEYELPQIYVLAMMNFTFDEHPEEHHHTVKLVNVEHGGIFYDKLTFVYVELPKFHKKESEISNDEERWLYALGNMGTLTERPTALSGPIFEHLFESARIAILGNMKMHEISAKLADEGIRNGEMRFALRKGREEGLAEGREQGQKEANKKAAKSLKDQGVPSSVIHTATGLSEDEILRL